MSDGRIWGACSSCYRRWSQGREKGGRLGGEPGPCSAQGGQERTRATGVGVGVWAVDRDGALRGHPTLGAQVAPGRVGWETVGEGALGYWRRMRLGERSSEVRRGRTAIRVAQKRGRGQCQEGCTGRGPPRGQAQQETRSWRGKGRGVTRTSEPGLPVAEGDSLAPSHLGLGPASGRSAPPGSCRQRQKEAARMRPWAPDRLWGPDPRFAARAWARASEEGRPRPSGALGSGRGGACACRWLGGPGTRPLHVGGRDSPELQLHPPAVEQDGGGLVVHTCERGSAEGLGCKAPLSCPSSKGSLGAGWGCTGRVGGARPGLPRRLRVPPSSCHPRTAPR